MVAEALADDEADGRVVGLLLQPLLWRMSVSMSCISRKKRQVLPSYVVIWNCGLRDHGPAGRRRGRAAAVVVARHESSVTGRPSGSLLPVVLGDLLEPKVGDAVVVAVVERIVSLKSASRPGSKMNGISTYGVSDGFSNVYSTVICRVNLGSGAEGGAG